MRNKVLSKGFFGELAIVEKIQLFKIIICLFFCSFQRTMERKRTTIPSYFHGWMVTGLSSVR